MRESDEFAIASPRGRLAMPMGEVPAGSSELPKDKTIAVLGAAAAPQRRVTEFLNENGFPTWPTSPADPRWSDAIEHPEVLVARSDREPMTRDPAHIRIVRPLADDRGGVELIE